MFGKSWKTTSAGITSITGGIVGLYFTIKSGNMTPEALMTEIGLIVTGIGFLCAKDSDVTGGTVQQ